MSKEIKYRRFALELLQMYVDSEVTVIGEFSGDFKKSAEILKKNVIKWLKKFDYDEAMFDELIKDSWISDYYAEGE